VDERGSGEQTAEGANVENGKELDKLSLQFLQLLRVAVAWKTSAQEKMAQWLAL
jgi:hypothetical protein